MRLRAAGTAILIAVVLVLGLDYVGYAATGRSVLLGGLNKERAATTIARTSHGPAVQFTTTKGSPPFAVTSPTKVARLNADSLDGLHAADLAPRITAIDPPGCTSLDDLGPTPDKIGDLGTFTQQARGGLTRVDFTTDLWVGSFDSGETGVVYELRLDGAPPTLGSDAIVLKQAGLDLPVHFTAVFAHLAPGHHTLSLWATASHTGAHQVYYDQGCYGSDGVNNLYVTQTR